MTQEETQELLKDTEGLANHLLMAIDGYGNPDKSNTQVFMALASMVAVGMDGYSPEEVRSTLEFFISDVLFFKDNATVQQRHQGTLQ